MRIDNQDVENIKNQTSIVSLISKYINVVSKGNSHAALCPFHNDSNPSLSISEDKKIFKCFSCGAGGDVFSFVKEYERISYPEAIIKVADFINYDLSKYEKSMPKKDEKKEKLLEINDQAASFYNYNLKTSLGEKGKEYFNKRNINNEIIDYFKLGYSPDDSSKIFSFLTKKQYKTEDIVESGIGYLSEQSFKDRFKGRVIFPIFDEFGKVIAFSARIIKDSKSAKYVNSSESKIFKKSEVLYNFDKAKNESRKENKIYIVEGFMDVFALYRANIKNVVATMGTSFGEKQVNLVKDLKVKVILALDFDDAGQNASMEILKKLLSKGVEVEVCLGEENDKDFDDVYNKNGEQALKKMLENTYSPFYFALDFYKRKTNFKNFTEKSLFIKNISDFIKKIAKDNIEKEHYIEVLSEKTNISKALIKQKVDDFKESMLNYQLPDKSRKSIRNRERRYYNAEVEILKQMLYNEQAVSYFINKKIGFINKENRLLSFYIVNQFEKEGKVDFKNIYSKISKAKDGEELAFKLKAIYKDSEISKDFNEATFKVISEQREVFYKIMDLEEKLKNEDEGKAKAKLNKEKMELIKKLSELRKKDNYQ